MTRILIIDDDPSIRDVLQSYMDLLGYQSAEAASGEEGLSLAQKEHFDLAFLDFRMSGMDGIETLKKLKEAMPLLPVILLTGTTNEAEVAIDAMRYGAYDYLSKPVEIERLEKVIHEALKASNQMRVMVEFETAEPPRDRRDRIIGRSPAMVELYKLIGKATTSNATVMITGESGTGKELVARAIYQHSRRADQIFLAVNCAAVPEPLLESILFGHEKGAFTGAVERHIGKFEQANEGTLLLDEVGELKLATQAKLLRVLQEKSFERVGGKEILKCDVRIIAATNKNLQSEIEKGNFREDLFYRLNVVHLHLPPLRERKEDIPELCNYLLGKLVTELEKPFPMLSAESLQVLQAHEWLGNVRELHNVLAKAMIMAPTPIILPEHLNLPHRTSAVADTKTPFTWGSFTQDQLDQMDSDIYHQVIEDLERRLLTYVLQRTSGNQVQASKILGISRSRLRERMQRFSLRSNLPSDKSGDSWF